MVRDGAGLAYRHELARQAVLSTIPTAGEPHLHALLLDALESSGHGEPALLTHHAVGAIDKERAFTHARTAAEEAARSAAHGEAVAFFDFSLRAPRRDDPAARAQLLLQLAFEQYLTSHLAEATDTVGATFALWQQAEDGAGLAAAYDRFSVFRYYAGDRHDAETYADRAARVAAETASPSRTAPRAPPAASSTTCVATRPARECAGRQQRWPRTPTSGCSGCGPT